MNRFVRRPVLAALTLFAALLQFWALDAQSLWYDEGFSVWLSQKPVVEIVALTAADIQPPLYYLLLHGWLRLTGTSEWALRWLSAACAVLAVPLAAQVARRLLRQRAAVWAAAGLVAVSPLWLWYGREVRNYALGLALLLAAAWALLALFDGAARGRAPRQRWGAALAVGAALAAALYVHYFALFVWAAWALVATAWGRRHRAARGPLLLAFGLPVLAYVPWVGVMVQRLGADRSYWAGTLSVREALEGALASWMVGHSMHETTAVAWGYAGAALAGLGLLALAARVRRRDDPLPWHHWWLTLGWLLGPLLGLLAIAWNRPKYNPRYVIFAAPAFIFCLAALVGWLWRRGAGGRLAATTLMLGLLVVGGVADRNLFRDPAFAKSDWRGVAATLATERAPDEPILLVSGHAFPVFEYYFPDASLVLRLPDERTLDTTAVLGLGASEPLAEALRDAPGVWLVRWQDEVVDPEGVVPALLRAAGGTPHDGPSFKDVRLDYWTLPPGADVGGALQPATPLDVRFGDALRLVGWSGVPGSTPVDAGLPLVLFWQAQRPLDEDFKVRLTVVDEAGFEYGVFDGRPTAYLFPTFRWQPGVTRLAALDVPLLPGTPPGDYWVQVAVYREGAEANLDVLDAAGAPRGQAVRLGPVALDPPEDDWQGAGPPDDTAWLDRALLGDVRLLAARLALPAQVEPGQRVPLTLWWRTGGPLPGATLHLGWSRGGAITESQRQGLANETWPGERWRPGDLLLTPLAVRVPRDLPPGDARLVAWLSDAAGRTSEPVTLGASEVVAGERSFLPPTVPTAQQATFGGTIRLLGYDLAPAAPDGTLRLTLFWEALGEPETSLTRFAHLLDAGGTIVPGAGADGLPVGGMRPTDGWVAGEFLTETVTLHLPPAAPPGPYTVELGWYDASDPALPRLPVRGEGADEAARRVLLEETISP